MVAEQVGALDRRECPSPTYIPVWYHAVVESHWDKPGVAGLALPYLLDGQRQLLVLIGLPATHAVAGEACDESQRVGGDRLPDSGTPVLPRPQIGGVAPDAHARCLQHALELLNRLCVLADV
jgi:hypothetical protein